MTVLVVLTGAGWFAWQKLAGPNCHGQTPLHIAAAPEIAPAIKSVADEWAKTVTGPSGTCVVVDVASTNPADVAAAIAKAHKVSLTGVGQASGKIRVPDIWIPDASTWLQRLRAAGPDLVPTQATSVAYSPVVLAMPEPVAQNIGWPGKKITWTDLLQQMSSNAQMQVGIVDPARNAAGLAGLLAVGAAATASGAKAQQAMVGAMRSLVAGRSAVPDDLLARFPRATDPATIASSLSAAPLSERAVIAYNQTQPPVPLASVYIEPAPAPLDYPYVVMPNLSQSLASLASGLGDQLTGPAFADQLAKVDLHAADGSTGAGFPDQRGAPKDATSSVPDAKSIVTALTTWTAIALPGRMLAVIDISGSMLAKVPTAGGATREQVTVEAAQRGLALFGDDWAVGLWTFSTLLNGSKDYRQLVPIGPLSTQRLAVQSALAGIKPKPGGNTGLYDTVLAAYKTVQNGWTPGRVNSVVILTDGQNEDANGISLDQLTGQLKQIADPKRPIQVIAIGIGTGVSRSELEKITNTTGGGVFIATDPSDIGSIFLQAIALRTDTGK